MTNELANPGFACPPRRPMVERGTAGVLPPGPPSPQQGGGEDGALPRRLRWVPAYPARASFAQMSLSPPYHVL